MQRHTPPLIREAHSWDKAVCELRRSLVVGVDAEMDSYYSYFPRLCLIQISSATSDFLVDPMCADLDLSALGDIFANPDQVKVLHAGENDIPYFRDRLNCKFENLFDTHLAARVLGYSRCGLAPLLEELFHVQLDKKFQTADWRLRPLPEDQAEYARMDTRFLLPLRDLMLQQLHTEKRWEEARSEFARSGRAVTARKDFDPEGWYRLKGSRGLSEASKSVLRALYIWRDGLARSRDVAVFRVLPEAVMLSIAQRLPDNVKDLKVLSRHRTVQSMAADMLEVIRQSRHKTPPPPRRRGEEASPMSRQQQRLYQRLREWRNALSEEKGVEPDRVAPNRLLKQIVLSLPDTMEGLSAVDGMDQWRLRVYGEPILKVLRS